MKISKKTAFVFVILVLIIIIFIFRFAYSIGQHNASLTVREATPKQLAEEMQSDNFYGKYTKSMLLVTGKIKEISEKGQNAFVQFETTNSPNALGKVSCEFVNNKKQIKQGDVIRVLTVAYNAQRQNSADVFMPNCYLLQ